jgi:predicted SnoaL-like aldol condensation-catalyzing enzyme
MTRLESIRLSINTLYADVFNKGNVDQLSKLIGKEYKQHNPLFPDGISPLVGYLRSAGSLPCEVKRMAIEGDLAFVHVCYPSWGGAMHAAVDIFRFDDDGKIVEHWDVLQPVPNTSANSNTMF